MGNLKHHLSGKKFGKLTVCDRKRNKHGIMGWRCECECGGEIIANGTDLVVGRITSCKCTQHKEKPEFSDVPAKYMPEYISWCRIKDRCFNEKCLDYPNYGGKGITICDEWKTNFAAFLKHIGKRPSPIHSVDRYPNKNGNYEPFNVRWATPKQQSRNLNKNIHLTFEGKTMIQQDWATELGVAHEAIRYHLSKGRPFDKIVFHLKAMLASGKSNRKWSQTFG